MNDKAISVLLIEDNPGDARLMQLALAEVVTTRFALNWVDNLAKGISRLRQGDIDVVLLDLSLPDGHGLQNIARVQQQAPKVPIVVLTGLNDETLAVKAVQEGAQDYLVKGQVDGNLLARALRYAIERKRTQQAIEAEKEQLSVTLRSIGDGVITTDIDGKVVLMNKVAESLTGWTQEEAQGRAFSEVFTIFNQKTREQWQNPIEKILKTGEILEQSKNTILTSRDGNSRVISHRGAPIRDREEQKVIGVVLVFQDITEKQKLEEELLKNRQLESIGVLAGGIAHDFNNILTIIIGNLSLAKSNIRPQEANYDTLSIAEKACQRAKDLAQQLLTFSKGGAPIKKTTSIADLIKDTCTFILTGSNVRGSYHIPSDLWAVEVDERQMSQVVNNLILNGIQSMPGGGTLDVSCENIHLGDRNLRPDVPLPPGKYVKIEIKDQGCGIAEENLRRIFEPFFTTKSQGSGLGLAITYSVIKKHDGFIKADSEVGKGTTFTILLPASQKVINPKSPAPSSSVMSSKVKILIMDDEDMVRDIASRILKFSGYNVAEARDGNEALDLYKAAKESGQPFAAVIMDLTIPGGMGGKEAVQRLMELDPEVKAIVSSGYSHDPVMANFAEYGFSGVVCKPYDIDTLKQTLQEIVTK